MIGSKQKLRRCNHPEDFGVSIRINADDIIRVSNIKFRGIQIDNNLAWNDQIKAINFQVSRAVGLLKYVTKFLNNDILCKVYRGLAEPYFSFCSSVWGCCKETKIKSIQRLQNKAAIIVANKSYDYSATSMLKELGWPSAKGYYI